MIDNRTPHFDLPLPDKDNFLEEDVTRIGEALSGIDFLLEHRPTKDEVVTQDKLDEVANAQTKKLASYSAFDNYSGDATTILITDAPIAGTFMMLAENTAKTENGGTIRRAGNGRLYERLFIGPIYAAWFGAGKNAPDNAPLINAAIEALAAKSAALLYGSGGVVVLPNERMAIKSTVNAKFGISLEGGGSDRYTTVLSVQSPFAGSAAVILRGDAGVSYTNAHMRYVCVACNNVPGVGGVLFAGAYNNSSVTDAWIEGVHGASIPLEFRPMNSSESPAPGTVCESVLLKDLYVLHYDDADAVTQPTIKLGRCQETTLVNTKAFSGRNNAGSKATSQAAILLEDCRGISILGGAAVGCKYGIQISAATRFVAGVKISGFTYEFVTEADIYAVGTNDYPVTCVDQDIPRHEAPNAKYGLIAEYLKSSDIHTGSLGSKLGLGVNGLTLRDFGSGTVTTTDGSARYVRHVAPSGTNNRTVISSSAGIEINAPVTTPGFRFTVDGRSDYWTLAWSASASVNNGFRLTHSSSRIALAVDDSGTASKIGFLGATPVVRPVVSGAKGGNAALTSVIAALKSLGLIDDTTT